MTGPLCGVGEIDTLGRAVAFPRRPTVRWRTMPPLLYSQEES